MQKLLSTMFQFNDFLLSCDDEHQTLSCISQIHVVMNGVVVGYAEWSFERSS